MVSTPQMIDFPWTFPNRKWYLFRGIESFLSPIPLLLHIQHAFSSKATKQVYTLFQWCLYLGIMLGLKTHRAVSSVQWLIHAGPHPRAAADQALYLAAGRLHTAALPQWHLPGLGSHPRRAAGRIRRLPGWCRVRVTTAPTQHEMDMHRGLKMLWENPPALYLIFAHHFTRTGNLQATHHLCHKPLRMIFLFCVLGWEPSGVIRGLGILPSDF